MNADLLIIGVGNRWRRDDGVGPLAAERLRRLGLPAIEHPGEGAGLMALWEGVGRVVVIDAARSAAPPGTQHRFDAQAGRLPTDCLHRSSHAFGVAEAVETARALGSLPAVLRVYGIEGADFGWGEGLTPAVAEALEAVLGEVSIWLADR